MKRYMHALPLLAMLPFASALAADIELELTAAWIREAPPVARVQAGYFTACNASASPMTLLGITSERFGRIEMHETIEANGETRMQELDTLEIDAGDCIDFSPGGRHLMLFKATTPVRDGDVITLILKLDVGEMAFDFPVRRGGDESSPAGHHHE